MQYKNTRATELLDNDLVADGEGWTVYEQDELLGNGNDPYENGTNGHHKIEDLFRNGSAPIESNENGKKQVDSKPNYLNICVEEYGSTPLLTREEEYVLAERIENGDEQAKEDFILANMRLVMSIAKRYVGVGLTKRDLYNEGYFGLVKAVEKYDRTRGNKFSSLAVWWIEKSIRNAVYHYRYSTLGSHAIVSMFKPMIDINDEFKKHQGHEATDEELAMIISSKKKKLTYETGLARVRHIKKLYFCLCVRF